MHVPDDIPDGGSVKVRCPFGFMHPDNGISPSFRLYSTNTAWCFVCDRHWTPTRLWSSFQDMNLENASKDLLNMFGYNGPLPSDKDWTWLMEPDPRPVPSAADLARALTTFCERTFPDWDHIQFDGKVSKILARGMSLLALVKTDEDASKWLEYMKKAMRVVVRGQCLLSSGHVADQTHP